MNIEQIKNEVKNIQNLFLGKNYKLIIKASKQAIKKYPNIPIFYNLLGLALHNLGEFSKAIIIFSQGCKIGNKDIALLNNLANAYKSNYEYAKADNIYRQILNLDRNYFNVYINYGNLKRELNFFKEANDLYYEALKLNKSNPEIHFSLAMNYQSLGNFDKAEFYGKEALKLDWNFTKADLLISRSKKYKDNEPHLTEMLNKIKNIKLNNIQKIHLNFAIGKAYEDLDDIEKSIKYIKVGNIIKNSLVKHDNVAIQNTFKSIKKSFLNLNQNKILKNFKVNSKTNIFILGMPRSGTTLIEQIISSHPEVYGSGELPFLSKIMRENFFDSDKRIILKDNLESTVYDEDLIKKISKLYFSYLDEFKINEEYITDKAPLNFYWIGFIKIFFPNSKIVHCKRNPQDNCLSLYKNYFEGELNFSYSEENLGTFYNLYNDLMNFWNENFPGSFLNINYEKIIDNQKDEIKRLISFCGLNWHENCLNFSKNKTPIKTVSVSQARSPIYKTSIQSYKKFKPYLKKLFDLVQ